MEYLPFLEYFIGEFNVITKEDGTTEISLDEDQLQGLEDAMAEFKDFLEGEEDFEFSEEEMAALKPFFDNTGNVDVINYLVVEMTTDERQQIQDTSDFIGECLKNANLENGFKLEFNDEDLEEFNEYKPYIEQMIGVVEVTDDNLETTVISITSEQTEALLNAYNMLVRMLE